MAVTWCNAYFSVGRTYPMRFICGWRLQATKLLLAAIAFFLPAISSAQSITGFTINHMGPVQGLEQLTVQFMSIVDTAPPSVMAISSPLIKDSNAANGLGYTGFTQGPGKLPAGEEVEVEPRWWVAAVGVKGDLLERSGATGPDLALVGAASWSSTALARTGEIVSLPVAATRLRLGIEGGWTFSLPRGGSLRPRLEAGARRDSGDAESAFGVALGGGVAWKDPRLGIALDVSGRALVSYEAGGIRDRGLAAELTLFPSAGNGVGLEITARW